jgi:hypothetical protein
MNDRKNVSHLLDKYDRLFIGIAFLLAIALHVLASYAPKFAWLSPLTSNWLSTAALVAVSTLFLRRTLSERRDLDAEILASKLMESYASRILQIDRIARCIVDFQERLKDFTWAPYLSKALSLDVIVAYHSSWIRENEEGLVCILEKSGSISFYLPDPDNLRIVEDTAVRFGSSEHFADPSVVDHIRSEIRNTRRALVDLYTTAGNESASLKIFFCPVNISYSAARIDNEYLVLSVFEHFGAARTGPPAVVLSLIRSDHLRNQFDKEFDQLAQAARMYGRVEELGRQENANKRLFSKSGNIERSNP